MALFSILSLVIHQINFQMEQKDKGTEVQGAGSATDYLSKNTREELTVKMAQSVLEYTLGDKLKKLDSELAIDGVFVTCEEIPCAEKDRRQHQAKIEVQVDGLGGIVAPLFLEKTYIGFCLEHLISKVINKFDDDFFPVLCPYIKAKEAFAKMLNGGSDLDNIEFGMMR